MSMKQLSLDTIKLLSSSQIITSASSVVKELMENSIDAQSTVIDIRLENYGLEKIEIRDNGIGISLSDVQMMCLRSYTSKISNITDLDKLTCYGFRGEALSSICAVADVTVTTKSEFDKYAMTFTMDCNGHVTKSSVSHHQNGTIITIANLFKKLPVRKQYYSSKKQCVNDLRRVENVVKSLTAIQKNIRVSLVHNKSVLWKMTPVNDLTITFGQIWSSSMFKYVKQLTFSNEEVKIDMVLPMQNIDVQNCFFTTNIADAIYLYVNKRPVRDSKIEKLIVGEFSNYFGHYLPPGKYLPCFVSLTVPPDTIDINLEPDKSRILFHNQEIILLNLKNCINKHYYKDIVENNQLEINKNTLKTYPTLKEKSSLESEEDIVENTQINNIPLPYPKMKRISSSESEEDIVEINQIEFNNITSKTHPNIKRKSSEDTEEIIVKKPTVLKSQIINSFTPIAESTKIFNDNLFDSKIKNDEHIQIIKELSFEEIDFEEPFTLKENNGDKKKISENNDDFGEYRNKLMNVTKNIPFQTIQSDDCSVNNFNAENISISQWSKGDVILNKKLLKSGVSIKANILNETLEGNTLPKIVKANEIHPSNYNIESQKDELVNIESNLSIQIKDKTTEDNIPDSKLNSSTKLAPLFRTVSVPDEQVPGLNHLVNRPYSWIPQPRSKKPIRDISKENLSETARSVSSQMGNKEMSGFTLFAKEMRIKILKDNPGMDFTKVSKELAQLWGCLTTVEKDNYKQLSNERKKEAIATKTNDIQYPKKSFQFVFSNLKRHSTLINIELSEIKRNVFEKPKVVLSEFTLIGQIERNSWICSVHNEIQIINICRLQEAVIFYQKLANDAIPLKMLDQPIKTNKKDLGENNFNYLMDLDTSYEPSAKKYTVKDERIVKNGFNVVIVFNDDNNNPDINITDVALYISIYGIEELKQLLELMQNENHLSCCRPLKVVNYIRSETVRYCKSTGFPKTKEEINNLLNYWFKNENVFLHNTCVHHKNVFTPIHTIDDLSNCSEI